jgi:enoyl-[acyl-carrier protein] reductase I
LFETGTWKAVFVLRMGQLMSLHKTGSQIIPADATSVADLEILVDKAVEAKVR